MLSRKSWKFILFFLTIAVLTATVFAVQTAVRVRFARGKSSATLSGAVGKYGKRDYILRGRKGQELWAKITSECESVTLDVIDSGTGQSITEPTIDYRDELPGTDDFIVRVQNLDLPSCKFTLKVGIE